MRSLRTLMLTLTAVLGTTANAAEDNVTGFTLDNGLDVVVIEDHRAPAVTHMMWYNVGAADEPTGKSGIAHLLEHLMFKATDELASGEFSEVVAANGGSDNAFTSWDYTAYFQRVAADRLGLMMQMEASRMDGLRLTEETVAPEIGVVLEERNQRTDSNPGALFGEQRRAAQFLHHPYGRPIIGWRHEIETLTKADAEAFYEAHYAPNNATLVVAGDVTPDEVRALAETHYGPIPANEAITARERVQEPPQLAERRVMFEDPRVAQPYVVRSYLAPERDPGDQTKAAALALLADLLGDDPTTSYLGQRLQFDTPVALYTSAYYNGTNVDDALFSFTAVPAAGVTLEDMEIALDETLAAFLAEPIDTDHLERLKRQRKAAEIYRQDSAQGRARAYGAALTVGLSLDDIAAWPDIVQAVTHEDIKAAAAEVFDRRNAVTGFLSAPAVSATSEVSQ